MLRRRPTVIVHHDRHDRELVANHRVEFRDREADGAIADEA